MSFSSAVVRVVLCLLPLLLLSCERASAQVVSSVYNDSTCTIPYPGTIDVLAAAAAVSPSAINLGAVDNYCVDNTATTSGIFNCYAGYERLGLVYWDRNVNCNGLRAEPFGADFNVTTLYADQIERDNATQCAPARYVKYNERGSAVQRLSVYMTFQCYNSTDSKGAAASTASLTPLLTLVAAVGAMVAMIMV